MFTIPAGRDRLVANSEGYPAVVIGRGEEATILKMREGEFSGLVCRSPCSNPSRIFTGREALIRFRVHQIAHSLFPANSLEVLAVICSPNYGQSFKEFLS